MKILLTLFLALAIAACSQSNRAPTPTAGASPADTLPSTRIPTETATPVLAPTKTQTPPRYNTPTETMTSLPTAIAFLGEYDLPAWLRDPNTPILAALLTDDNENTRSMSFVNASMVESYAVPMPQDIVAYFWLDASHFDFLSTDRQTVYQMDTETGQIVTGVLSAETTSLLGNNLGGA